MPNCQKGTGNIFLSLYAKPENKKSGPRAHLQKTVHSLVPFSLSAENLVRDEEDDCVCQRKQDNLKQAIWQQFHNEKRGENGCKEQHRTPLFRHVSPINEQEAQCERSAERANEKERDTPHENRLFFRRRVHPSFSRFASTMLRHRLTHVST